MRTRTVPPITNATFHRPITLLGVWAHPDDESYLSAVAMNRVANAGGRVVLATATRGERGGDRDPRWLAELRAHELRAAMSTLGVHDVRFLGHADGECANADFCGAVDTISTLIEDVQPNVILTFGPDGMTNHPDHIAVSAWTTAAAVATGRQGALLYATFTEEFASEYDELHTRLGVWMGDGEPIAVPRADLDVHIVATARELRLKRRALRSHVSQIAPLIDLIGADAFDGWWTDEFFRRPTAAEWEAAQLAVVGDV
jgi:LmbE family N-acetylglucosaminyl deacetylase